MSSEQAQSTAHKDTTQVAAGNNNDPVARDEQVINPTLNAALPRRWMSVKNPLAHSVETLMLMNNLEVIKLSDQISKLTEMVADYKIGPRSSKAGSRRTSDASLHSSHLEDDKADDAAFSAAAAADEAIQSFVKRESFCHRAGGKGKGKAEQVSTVTQTHQTNVDRKESQDTEANTPRNRVEKGKGSTPLAVTAEFVDATS
ncbi:hypothetical protein NW762_014492 [Fusarium torreyae]|uniref:Uncharacterized protein n=1 Tax=Fusarium torreyae TaxID=1237075 RepID=A0A9W8RLC2_9HYPO|nr:hypothetical protein NW762_014492 [Fusarium torreyae]